MDRCTYCRRYKIDDQKAIVHETGCPQVIPAYRKIYSEGWGDGRQGRKETSDHVAYKMGYGNGIIAAEEAENGYKAWGY